MLDNLLSDPVLHHARQVILNSAQAMSHSSNIEEYINIARTAVLQVQSQLTTLAQSTQHILESIREEDAVVVTQLISAEMAMLDAQTFAQFAKEAVESVKLLPHVEKVAQDLLSALAIEAETGVTEMQQRINTLRQAFDQKHPVFVGSDSIKKEAYLAQLGLTHATFFAAKINYFFQKASEQLEQHVDKNACSAARMMLTQATQALDAVKTLIEKAATAAVEILPSAHGESMGAVYSRWASTAKEVRAALETQKLLGALNKAEQVLAEQAQAGYDVIAKLELENKKIELCRAKLYHDSVQALFDCEDNHQPITTEIFKTQRLLARTKYKTRPEQEVLLKILTKKMAKLEKALTDNVASGAQSDFALENPDADNEKSIWVTPRAYKERATANKASIVQLQAEIALIAPSGPAIVPLSKVTRAQKAREVPVKTPQKATRLR